jgi:hypothetical protein
MIGKNRIQALSAGQKKGWAKAQAGGTTERFLEKHPGVVKHQEKVAARTARRAEKPRRPLGGIIGGNVGAPKL